MPSSMMAQLICCSNFPDELGCQRICESETLTGFNCWKSPPKTILYPPKGKCESPKFCRCFIIWTNSASFRNDTSSITRMRTLSNICLSASLRVSLLRKVAEEVVSPPNAAAAEPVYTMKKCVVSPYNQSSFTELKTKALCNLHSSTFFSIQQNLSQTLTIGLLHHGFVEAQSKM